MILAYIPKGWGNSDMGTKKLRAIMNLNTNVWKVVSQTSLCSLLSNSSERCIPNASDIASAIAIVNIPPITMAFDWNPVCNPTISPRVVMTPDVKPKPIPFLRDLTFSHLAHGYTFKSLFSRLLVVFLKLTLFCREERRLVHISKKQKEDKNTKSLWYVFMVVDFHVHIKRKERIIRADFEDIYKAMDEAGVSFSVVFPSAYDSEDLLESSLEIIEKEKLIPFLRFNPNKHSLEEVKNIEEGFLGFKLHPRLENFDPLDEKFYNIFDFIERAGKPVIFHTDPYDPKSDPYRILELKEIFPRLKIVLAHFVLDNMDVFRKIKRLEDVYIETSFCLSPKILEKRVKEVGPERFLFGSDFPYGDMLIERLKIERSNLKRKEKERILFLNAMELLKLKHIS